MEPKSSLPCSQRVRHWSLSWARCVLLTYKSAPLDYILSQLNAVRPIYPCPPKVYLNVILPPTPRSSQWSLRFGPPIENPVNTSPLPHACHMSRLPQPPWLNHPNNIRWRIQVMKFPCYKHEAWTGVDKAVFWCHGTPFIRLYATGLLRWVQSSVREAGIRWY